MCENLIQIIKFTILLYYRIDAVDQDLLRTRGAIQLLGIMLVISFDLDMLDCPTDYDI